MPKSVEGPIAYLGPAGTFSEEAVLKLFEESVPRVPCKSFDEVLESVVANRAQAGVIAIENNTNGTVTHAIDLLLDTPLSIVGEVTVQVNHNLLTHAQELSALRTIYAHPQALAQCAHWLSDYVPQAVQVPVSSNAEGARLASLDPSVAGIASLRAGVLYKVPALARSIQDGLSNMTRFLLMSKRSGFIEENEQMKWKTSIVFSVPNRPGALYEVLSHMANHGVQMVRIESRPARNGAWDYNFYIDFEGHTKATNVAQALQEVENIANFYRCFGSYPVLPM